jgi:hypothetical protein
MNVRLAAQILTRSVAIALIRYLPDDNEAKHLSTFIQDINDWFGLMNSNHPGQKEEFKKPSNCSYEQLGLLNRVRDSASQYPHR